MSNGLSRLRRMDAAEVRFRAAMELRKLGDRARCAISRPRWDRERLQSILATRAPDGSRRWPDLRRAVSEGRWTTAHGMLAAHFASRSSAFPLDARDVASLSTEIASRFPSAAADACARADRILRGQYDLLGHVDVECGHPPDWHRDAVHDRRAAGGFWAAIPYLDPQYGDHKVIWELNRHQHWLALGRALSLTGDSRYFTAFRLQLEHWIAHNPPLAGMNWASMLELAFRCLSWLWALAFFSAAALSEADAAVPWLVDVLVAMDRQLAHVERNLSRYFSPNTHLTGEALALYVAGTCLPELAASPRRARVGRDVLLREAKRQVLTDGGHAELSAHYHRYSTDFYLLALAVARASGDDAAESFADAARRQAAYLRTIADDRGRIPQLGDDDGGQLFPIAGRPPDDCAVTLAIAAFLLDDERLRTGETPEEAFWFCGASAAGTGTAAPPVHWPSRALSASGYYVSRTASHDHLVFDAGHHGYLNGGHAHSDALAIVLGVDSQPLLIDPGTATYTMDRSARDLFRSTAMHNTVVVNGAAQSRPRGPFHWQSVANARPCIARTGEECDYFEGTHDGYAPLVHTRGVLALHGMGWLVVDHILGGGSAQADAYWHLAPSWQVRTESERTAALASPDGMRVVIAASKPIQALGQGATGSSTGTSLDCWSPVYGRVERSRTLHAKTTDDLPTSFATFFTTITAAAAEFDTSVLVHRDEILVSPGLGWHGAAFTVSSPRAVVTALTRVEDGGRTSGSVASPPAGMWGTRMLLTDARLAVVITRPGRLSEIVLVDGTTIVDSERRPIVQLERPVALRRANATTGLASTVHSSTNC